MLYFKLQLRRFNDSRLLNARRYDPRGKIDQNITPAMRRSSS